MQLSLEPRHYIVFHDNHDNLVERGETAVVSIVVEIAITIGTDMAC